jgi:hypothetical protein
MSETVRELYYSISLNKNQLLNSRLHNLSTSERIILGTSLTIDDKGFQVFDTDYLVPYWWDGYSWLSTGGVVEWGRISGSVINQEDLIIFLDQNYYSITNPNNFISGTGLQNKIVKWGADNTLINSIITENNNEVSINGTFIINKIIPSGSTIFKINSGGSALGSQFEFENYLDAGLLKIGYFGNTGNRIEINGGSDNNGSRISFYEKIGSSAPTLNIKIDSRTFAYTYFNAGNVIIGTNINSIYKFDVNGNARIGSGSTESSALLHLSSTSKGFLKPKMTTLQRTSITAPATGLEVYDTSLNLSYYYNGASWVAIGGGGSSTWGSITGTLSAQEDLQNALNAKQNTLVSGTNIKTVNGQTLLGSGDVSIKDLTTGTPALTDLLIFANPTTGLAKKSTITQIGSALQTYPIDTTNANDGDFAKFGPNGTIFFESIVIPNAGNPTPGYYTFMSFSESTTFESGGMRQSMDYPGITLSDRGFASDFDCVLFNLDSLSRGFLMPRLASTDRVDIISPPKGLEVFDSTLNIPYFYNGTTWKGVQEVLVSGTNIKTVNGNSLLGSGNITIAGGTGLTSLNALTASTQTFATSTTGTDFTITSATSTHTFNLPSASATNRGLLTASDWTTFNNKQSLLVSGTNIKTINGATILGSGNIVISGGTGLTSLNGLTAGTQLFSVASTGTDFTITSTTDTHTFAIPTASASARGLLSSADWTTFNNKQVALNGTGFVKISGTTISYDNSTYLTSITSSNVTTALGFTPYNSTNPSGFITLTSLSAGTGISYSNITGVISSTITQYTDALARASLSFAAGSGAYNSTTGVITIPTNNSQLTNGAGYITGITSGNVTTALGFTPQAALSGTGFVKSTAGTISYDTSTYLTANQSITLSGDISGTGTTAITTTLTTITQASTGSFVKITLDTKGRVTGNTAVGSSDITTALGYTPYNATNPNGYITSSGTAANVSGTVAIVNGGTGATSASAALTALGAYAASNPSGYISANQTITLSGDVTGSGTTAITSTLATVSQASSGNFVKVTLDTKGRVTGNTAVTASDITALGFAVSTITTNRQTASYTLVLSDANKLVEMNVATANTLTVPTNASVAFPIGTQILISQYGAGACTITAASGVTLRSESSKLKTNGQYSGATLVKIATDEWYVFGNLIA